ncbi:single-stranded-DNA-specific exonuclease RecJ [Candidatus Desantisbacteria bacterium CG_4_9_14_3_um_filter_40_11]|uniref:Single-stranded-DNA-specific exonuclease RecJ n=1 Tax=Candidatus Desantisbacteria bacterium CG_4_9_14_3_um_filter_40_11 TaxID=1974546 RepID=A0A2M8ATB5_9BACT|nr:MAG: single-stranded-DNA-specific exonuclease RecJ [Candidatus Desantisbacteria bacterium CG_4_9_14_3_um_filter_40_11]
MKWEKIQLSDANWQDIISAEVKISPILAKILVAKGITKSEDARRFLYPDLKDMHSPSLMKGVEQTVNRILQAVKDKQKIMIYGDYDVDGITATVLFVRVFRSMGAEVLSYLPNRFVDGYGLSNQGIDYAVSNDVSLIITVDCGISAVDVVDYGNQSGLDIIITDHHEPKDVLPSAYAIVNPKQPGCSYPDKDLSGVGVALKIIHALMQTTNVPVSFTALLALAAIGTVADIVPITGENRIIVRHGLKILSSTREPGLVSLLEVSGIRGKVIDTADVGFKLGPRLNASGRMEDASLSLDLLLSHTHHEAIRLAKILDEKNTLRQQIQKEVFEEAKQLVGHPDNKKVIVVAKDNWHQGVVGIVASKMVNEYGRPAIVIAYDNENGKGSGRSIPQFHLLNSLTKCDALLQAYGGHKHAAGLSIKKEHVDEFRKMINVYADEVLTDEDMVQSMEVFEVNLEEVTPKLVFELENLLAPFGIGNPRPIFSSSSVGIADMPRIVGNNHLKMKISSCLRQIDTIGFGLGGVWNGISANRKKVNIAYRPQMNEWDGMSTLQLSLKDIHVA